MSKPIKHPDITPEELEFELRDHRKMAYNEYLRFKAECDRRKAAFEQAQTNHCFLLRRLYAIVHKFSDRHNAIRERKLLQECRQRH